MNELFNETRQDLEASNGMLSVTLDEALSLCKESRYESARERVYVFDALFDPKRSNDRKQGQKGRQDDKRQRKPVNGPVSYTHLTLPTIYSV